MADGIEKKEVLYRLTAFLAIVGYLTLLFLAGDIYHREWYVDEHHFIPTIRMFYERPGIETLRTYPEVAGPMSFVMYAMWAKVAGFSTFRLRLFSMALSAASLMLIYWIVCEQSGSHRKGLAAMFVCQLNPYFAGLSVFVFTDMAMLLFLLIAYCRFIKEKPFSAGTALACALLCRQFAGFFIGAVICYSTLRWLKMRRKKDLKMVLAAFCSVIPLGLLFILWGGIATKEGLKIYAYTVKLRYLNHLVFYCATLWVYVFPLLMWRSRDFFSNKRPWIVGVAAALIYPFFPVTLSEVTRLDGYYPSNGLIHRAIQAITPNSVSEHAVLMLFFIVGSYVVVNIAISMLRHIKQGKYGEGLLLELSLFIFLLLMPLQYQIWEKYLFMVVPFVVIYLTCFRLTSVVSNKQV